MSIMVLHKGKPQGEYKLPLYSVTESSEQEDGRDDGMTHTVEQHVTDSLRTARWPTGLRDPKARNDVSPVTRG